MDNNSYNGRVEEMQKRKAARLKKVKITKIAITCALVLVIALGFVLIKHSADSKKIDKESEAINTVKQESTTNANLNDTPITAAPTTTEAPTEASTNASETTTIALGEYSIQAYNAEMYATANVRIRSIPSTDGELLGEVKLNEKVKITGKSNNNWYRVEYNGIEGYCSGQYFSESKAKDTGDYLIKVNRTQNIVTVYTKDSNGEFTVAKKAMTCSVGLNDNTPTGTFKTSDKYTWRLLSGNVYGQYATRITGHILFHSVPYFTENKNDLEYDEYNKLGKAASLGCVRLAVQDAKWIYDNCKSGTTVIIYDSTSAEPLTPPSPIRIDTNDSRRGWDPTDPDAKNPWKN